MKRNIAYKYRIYPNEQQMILFSKTFGCCRKVYNLMLEEKRETYLANGKPIKVTPARYKKRYEYLCEVDSLALANEQLHLETAFKNYFKDKKVGLPKYKSKKKDKDSYTTNYVNGNIYIYDNSIKLPKLGKVKAKIHRMVPNEYKLKSVTMTREKDGCCYASVLYEYEVEDIEKVEVINHIGLDYKNDGLYIDSNGNSASMPRYYKISQKKLRKLQKRLSKKNKESNNYQKQKRKIAKLSRHVSNQRKDFHHKSANELCNKNELISVESLNLKEISKKEKKMGKVIHDNGYGAFIKILEYKQERRRQYLIKVDQYYASSQICSTCGHKNPITKDLGVKEITCPKCGTIYDRDINAAINIDKEGLRIYLNN